MTAAVLPAVVGIPVGHMTPDECVCPACRTFEIEPGTSMCPRCNRRAAIRAARNAVKQRHFEHVRSELQRLKGPTA